MRSHNIVQNSCTSCWRETGPQRSAFVSPSVETAHAERCKLAGLGYVADEQRQLSAVAPPLGGGEACTATGAADDGEEKALLAEMLILPSEAYLHEEMAEIDVEADVARGEGQPK